MHPHALLVTRFYEAFQRRDAEAMAECYRPEATFTDPVFRDLKGAEVGAMWRMLCGAARDLEVRFADVVADDERGSARWEATYSFGPAKRRVQNVIASSFRFHDGRIVAHEDSFDLYRWTRMALGPLGVALGWTPMVQQRVRRDARARLARQLQR